MNYKIKCETGVFFLKQKKTLRAKVIELLKKITK